MVDPMPTIHSILYPERRQPEVVFDSDGAALGINWEKAANDMDLGLPAEESSDD
jgi:hypothetical protein